MKPTNNQYLVNSDKYHRNAKPISHMKNNSFDSRLNFYPGKVVCHTVDLKSNSGAFGNNPEGGNAGSHFNRFSSSHIQNNLSPYSDSKPEMMQSHSQLNTRDIEGAYPQRFRHKSKK